jgi:hypothetical protein
VETGENKSSWTDSPKTVVFAIAALEVFITIAAGFLARSSFADPRVGSALGFCIWFAGGLMTLNAVIFQFRLDAAVQRELRAVIGEESDRTRRVLSIFNTYHSIGHPDVRKYRDEVLNTALTKLEGLNRGEVEVEGDEYYAWLNDKIRQAKTVQAVSCRPLRVYNEDNREKNWAHENLAAANRGTQITRIFILECNELVSSDVRALLRRLILDSSVKAFVVWRDEVDKQVLRRMLGGGFSIYDNEVVFWDRSYFEKDVGITDGTPLTSIKPLVPRASIFCKPNATVSDYINIFRGLEGLVPYPAKSGPQASYSEVLREVEIYLLGAYGALEALESENDPTKAALIGEWKALKQEISELPSATGSRKMLNS